MQSTSKANISELKMLISKLPLRVSCATVLPEFGLRWRDVAVAIRGANLPMTSQSVASVLTKYACNSFTVDETSDIITRLKLKSVATQNRRWHVVKLIDQIDDEPANFMTTILPSRIEHVLTDSKSLRNRRAEVQTVKLGNLIYISVHTGPLDRRGSVFYIAIPPGEPVALVSSLSSRLLSGCVQALGYRTYEDACLNGKDVMSLLHIFNSQQNTLEVVGFPEHTMAPSACRSGVDYTGMRAVERYAGELLGPEPPLLSELTVTVEKKFYDPARLNKKMKMTMHLKSENIAQTLQSMVTKNGISPRSELFKIFHTIKSNRIHIDADGTSSE